jgi:hypothetical protein
LGIVEGKFAHSLELIFHPHGGAATALLHLLEEFIDPSEK